MRTFPTWLLLLPIVILMGCRPTTEDLNGRVMLWHSWNEADAEVLQNVLRQFEEIEPNVDIVSVPIPADEMEERFRSAVAQGLGPDLMIGPSAWMPELVRDGLLSEMEDGDLVTVNLNQTALDDLRYQERLYGLPLSVSTQVLFYNTERVETPTQSLSGLVSAAEAGQAVVLPIDFLHGYWGIRAYGDDLFSDEDTLNLAESGLPAWLEWLRGTQDVVGIIQVGSPENALPLFIDGRVAYYVGTHDELPRIEEALGPEAVGVAPLPGGPNGPPSPLLDIEAIMLGSTSSERQSRIAQELARFLTNTEPSARFLRETGRVPANWRLNVDSRIFPQLGPVAAQSRTGVTLPNTWDRVALIERGDVAYANVLGGIQTPREALCEFGITLIETQTVDAANVILPPNCPVATEAEE